MHYRSINPKNASATLYIGLDIDDQAFHGHVLPCNKEEGIPFKTKPSAGQLIKVLEKFKTHGLELKICYEATYIGYSLQRTLEKEGYACQIIAPSLIPRTPGVQVKTDKVDSRKLAYYYKKGMLTPIHIPSEEQEAVRDLLRSRRFIKKQATKIKHHLWSHTRKLGLHYRAETNNPKGTYWTQSHLQWLRGKIKRFDSDPLKLQLSLLLTRLHAFEEEAKNYDQEIRNLAEHSVYKDRVRALTCYRGIDVLSAISLVTEIGDIRRFDSPRRLTSYAGMDLREYSSGGKERKFSMTKLGNRHIRTCVIEACQLAAYPCIVSKPLKERRKDVSEHLVKIADKCMKRLQKKARKMLYQKKHTNVVKTACGRELLGFIWESLLAVN